MQKRKRKTFGAMSSRELEDYIDSSSNGEGRQGMRAQIQRPADTVFEVCEQKGRYHSQVKMQEQVMKA
jgi:hypothetical protein